MPSYHYKAVDRIGRPARGSLRAANDVDLELRLKRMGLDLITCREARQGALRVPRQRVSRQELITFCFHLEQVQRSGVPFLQGLRDLRDSTANPHFREIAATILEDMEGGKLLSQALAAHPKIFNGVFVSLVKAGEQSGRLDEVFANLAAHMKWQDELLAQTRRLLIYPALVLAVMSAVVVFLLLYVVPQLATLLRSMDVALPLQTRVLIALSRGFAAYWPVVFGLPALVAGAAALAVAKNAKARYLLDYLKLRLPVTGSILQKIILARFASFLALMYQSGIGLLDALRTCEEIVGNRVLADALQRAGQQIGAGDGLTESFRNLGFFPPLVLRMLGVGESTGALDSALLNVSYFYDRETKDTLEKALKLLEPTLTAILGLILGLIMYSVLMPIYDVLGKLPV